MINDAYAVDVPTWSDFKQYVSQLTTDPDLKDQFNTVTIDTISLAYDRCESYVCNREHVEKIADIPFGGGYKMVDQEYSRELNKLTMAGYGLVMIGHEKIRVETNGQSSCKYITPDLPDRAAKIINRMVDLTAYMGMEEGVRYIYPRQITLTAGTQSVEIYAGSHFANLNDKIELGYEPLVNAIAEAMATNTKGEKIELVDGPVVVQQEEKLDFKAIRTRIGMIAKKLVSLDEQAGNNNNMLEYKKIVEEFLGKNRLVKDCDEAQVEHLNLIVIALEKYITENGITC